MTYEQWEEGVPQAIRGDTLWSVKAYRLGLFLSDLVWRDSDKLLRNPKSREIADQLVRAAGKISACIGEGYSRNTGKARATFYEYACGSARESRDWYYKGRFVFALQAAGASPRPHDTNRAPDAEDDRQRTTPRKGMMAPSSPSFYVLRVMFYSFHRCPFFRVPHKFTLIPNSAAIAAFVSIAPSADFASLA